MTTDTPNPFAATTHPRFAIRSAIRALDGNTDVTATSSLSTLRVALAPIVACAASVGEPGAAAHMDRVGSIAESIALARGWDPSAAAELRFHGLLHDVGKLCVSADLLNKPGPLTAEERQAVECHAVLGFALLDGSSLPLLQTAARVAHEHHEWWDGRGYPRRLAGTAIDPCARVIALADVYDALTSPRAYRGAYSPEVALEMMREGRGTQFDPELFDAFEAAWRTCGSRAVCRQAA